MADVKHPPPLPPKKFSWELDLGRGNPLERYPYFLDPIKNFCSTV